MKILFITDLYPIKPDEKNTPRTLHNFVFEWIKQGNSVDVVKPNFLFNSFVRGKRFYKSKFYDFEGVRIFNVNYFSPFLFDMTKKMPVELDISAYDVIVAHMPSGIIFADKLAKKFNKPLVCAVHNSDLEVLKNPLYKIYFRARMMEAYESAKKIACRSFVLQKKFNEFFPQFKEKTFVAPSGVAEGKGERGKGKRITAHLPPLNILTCANLIKRKNIDKLILAVNQLDDFELKIIGDGKELKKLKLLSRSGIPARQNKIEFLGQLSHEKVLEEMAKSDIFILPSVNETFGLVYLEAMMKGCIVVCTKNDGVDGIIIYGENGFLTEPTVEGIKKVLLKIKSFDDLERIRENSLATVKNYTLEICAQNYLDNLK